MTYNINIARRLARPQRLLVIWMVVVMVNMMLIIRGNGGPIVILGVVLARGVVGAHVAAAVVVRSHAISASIWTEEKSSTKPL